MNRLEKLEISNVIGDFRAALETLDRYDHQQLELPKSGVLAGRIRFAEVPLGLAETLAFQ